MPSLLSQLRDCFAAALLRAFGEAARDTDPLIKPSSEEKFGDYQCNVAMSLAKRLAIPPRDAAQRLVEALDQVLARGPAPFILQVSGPGFINIRLKRDWLEELLAAVPDGDALDRMGIQPVPPDRRDGVVIDYSSPNVAKQMHVGHLRSTIIGDTIARVLEFEGHEVIRQNHVGDWGTQFGIILEECFARGLLPRGLAPDHSFIPGAQLPHDPDEWEKIYRAGNAKMSQPEFAARAKEAVTRLQSGAASETAAWRWVTLRSLEGVCALYERLGVTLRGEHTRGESFYNPLLAPVVEELRAALLESSPANSIGKQVVEADALRAVCRVDQGALCVFLERPDGSPAFKGPKGDPLPIIVQKTDGAFLYASTDLAAAAFRINDFRRRPLRLVTRSLAEALRSRLELPPGDPARDRGGLGGTRLLYVVGAPQRLHFEMLFAVVRALGWTRPDGASRDVRLEHVAFGSILGGDRKMLRTRTGENVKLAELLDEAEKRARDLIDQNEAKRAEMGLDPLPEEEKQNIARAVGIGAVKYADLSQNRNSDYVFNWDKMLAMQGNTAPYLMYAYARIRSIYRKAAASIHAPQPSGRPAALAHPAELALGKRLLQLAETLDAVSESLTPHVLCDYLYGLAGEFMAFYENCPVLQAPDETTRRSRLRLCDLTARTLRLGLGLLDIEALERM